MRDELLTGYLDGQLSQDERRRVERMLETDSEAREVFERLSANRDVLRQLGSDAPQLSAAFAQRVWAATQAAAREHNLAPSHPVRRAVAQASGGHERGLLQHGWKIAGALMAALAASLLIGLTVFQATITEDVSIARQDISESADDLPVLADNQGTETQPAAEGQLEQPIPIQPQRDALVDRSAQPRQPLPDSQLPENEDSENAVGAADGAPSAEPMLAEADRSEAAAEKAPPAQGPGAYDALADLLPGAAGGADRGALPAGPALQAVLMYEVELTERGVARGILDHALSEAGIELGDQAVLDAETVDSLASVQLATPDEAAADADDPAQLWFIEAPMQRIEYFFFTLAAASEDVERVGYKLVMNPPVITAAREMAQVDPKALRQPGGTNLAIQLAFESAGRRAEEFVVAGDLGTAAMQPGALPTKEDFETALRDAETVISPVLVLVRMPQDAQ